MKPTWQTSDGAVQLWLGDALDVLPTLAAGSVDMIWTDPPYGHGNADGDLLSRRAEAFVDGIKTRHEPIANDSPETMRIVVDGALREAARILKHDCCCCCCCCCGGGGPSPTFAWVANRMDAEGLTTRAKTSLRLYGDPIPPFVKSALLGISPPKQLPPISQAFGGDNK